MSEFLRRHTYRQWVVMLVAAIGGAGGWPARPAEADIPKPTPPPAGEVAPAEPTQPAPAELEAVDVTTLAEADWLVRRGHYDQALAAYEQLLGDDEQGRLARLGRARAWIETGLYQQAINELRSHPQEESAEWHSRLAEALAAVGDYEAALDQAAQAVRHAPDNPQLRWQHAQLLEYLGQRDAAIEAYAWFEPLIVGPGARLRKDAEWLTYAGQGFLRYSVLTRKDVVRRTQHVLAQMLQMAYERIDRFYWPARLAAADLLCGKYNHDPVAGSVSDYQGALRINEALPAAHVGLGVVALEQWSFEEVDGHVERALAANPHYAPALHLLATCRLYQRRHDEAEQLCQQALAVNPHDLHALALSAGVAACRHDADGVAAFTERARAVNPRCALFHLTMGQVLSHTRQFSECERHLLAAIEYDPTDANARTELGEMYMQWGEEEKARAALEAAWALDPYNERTKFTLDLLEQLESFAQHETEHFIIKYDADHDPGLGPLLGPFMERAYEQVTGDYDFEPTSKTIIEVFPTHRAFGVRITGRPWVHTVGACTGRVIALDAPRASVETMGPYNIAQVLRHEFAHTVTLEATGNLIPHWYTEALAQLSEEVPRDFSRWELLAQTVRRDELFPVSSINWGFWRPTKPYHTMLAYTQSQWMAEYIIERFGYAKLTSLLRAFRAGLSQAEVFDQEFGLTEAQFDHDFEAWARQELERWGFDLTPIPDPAELRVQLAALDADDPHRADLQGRLAEAELAADREDEAEEAANAALALDDHEPHALEVRAKLLIQQANHEQGLAAKLSFRQEALSLLEKLVAVEPDSWLAHRGLGELYAVRGEPAAAERHFERLQALCPLDAASWRGLSAIYLEREAWEQALPQLTELARLEPHDAQVPAGVARINRRLGRLAEAIYWYNQALYIEPTNVKLRRDLAATYLVADQPELALETFLLLTLVEPEEADHWSQAALVAHKLSQTEIARELATRAVALDPEAPCAPLAQAGGE